MPLITTFNSWCLVRTTTLSNSIQVESNARLWVVQEHNAGYRETVSLWKKMQEVVTFARFSFSVSMQWASASPEFSATFTHARIYCFQSKLATRTADILAGGVTEPTTLLLGGKLRVAHEQVATHHHVSSIQVPKHFKFIASFFFDSSSLCTNKRHMPANRFWFFRKFQWSHCEPSTFG